ncbi:MAG: hypothetical protein AMXMBFR64_17800 [Myxococcales bacterium]
MADVRLLRRATGSGEGMALSEVGRFRAPLGEPEADALRWFLESCILWPGDVFAARARQIEADLPRWGHAMLQAVRGSVPEAEELLHGWLDQSEGGRRLLTVQVGAGEASAKGAAPRTAGDAVARSTTGTTAARGAAAALALPWDLLHDGAAYLFQEQPRVAVRRHVVVASRRGRATEVTCDGLRVLVVVARPEKAGLIDPRSCGSVGCTSRRRSRWSVRRAAPTGCPLPTRWRSRPPRSGTWCAP